MLSQKISLKLYRREILVVFCAVSLAHSVQAQLSEESARIENGKNFIMLHSTIFRCGNGYIGILQRGQNDFWASMYNQNKDITTYVRGHLTISLEKNKAFFNWERNKRDYTYEFVQDTDADGKNGFLFIKDMSSGMINKVSCELNKEPGKMF